MNTVITILDFTQPAQGGNAVMPTIEQIDITSPDAFGALEAVIDALVNPVRVLTFAESVATGAVVDETEFARAEFGYLPKVALTRALSEHLDNLPPSLPCHTRQSRLGDLLSVLKLHITLGDPNRSRIEFPISLPTSADEPLSIDIDEYPVLNIVATARTGDRGETVILLAIQDEG